MRGLFLDVIGGGLILGGLLERLLFGQFWLLFERGLDTWLGGLHLWLVRLITRLRLIRRLMLLFLL